MESVQNIPLSSLLSLLAPAYGRGVLVLSGSTIAVHTVAAAGSAVKGEVPARVLSDGNPARGVRHLEIIDGWTGH